MSVALDLMLTMYGREKMNKEVLLDALKQKYRGEIAAARANLDVYLFNPAGIGEHPDIIGAMDEQLAKLAEADEKLETLNKYFS